MNLSNSLLPLILASSLLPGIAIFFMREGSHRLRTSLNLFGAFAKLAMVGFLTWGVLQEQQFETRWELAPQLELVLHADALSVLFVSLSTLLWMVRMVS